MTEQAGASQRPDAQGHFFFCLLFSSLSSFFAVKEKYQFSLLFYFLS
jgi:hypothetical protein